MPPAEQWRRRRSLLRQRRHYPRLMSRLRRRRHSGVDSEACLAEGPQRQPVVRRQQRLSCLATARRRRRRHPGRGNAGARAAQLAQPSVRCFEADACALDQTRSRLVLAVWAAEQLRRAEDVRG
jgi:hypothetical protein